MLKGPTGCGKTRFVEHMAWRLGKPLITVAAHEDMTAADLAGRYLLEPEGTVWHDGPLTQAVRQGAICYLDEIVEARQDTTVVIHPLTDARRILPLEKHNEIVPAHPDFQLTISYNPGYQSAVKDLKESTKQRFLAIDFSYPPPQVESAIVARESGADAALADMLVAIGAALAQSAGPRARRRRLDPDADPCRPAGARRPAARHRRAIEHRAADHRQSRRPRRRCARRSTRACRERGRSAQSGAARPAGAAATRRLHRLMRQRDALAGAVPRDAGPS